MCQKTKDLDGGVWPSKYGEFFSTAPNGIIGSGGSRNSSAMAAEAVSSSAARSLPSTRAGGQDDVS